MHFQCTMPVHDFKHSIEKLHHNDKSVSGLFILGPVRYIIVFICTDVFNPMGFATHGRFF